MPIDPAQWQRLTEEFLKENAKLNLSAFRTKELCMRGNVEDSLAFLQVRETFPDLGSVRRVLDMGTGGGFPLLPLAIAMPEASFTGVDSVQKKIAAIGRIVSALGVTNVRLSTARLEELGHDPAERASYDLVTARALAELPILLEYGIPLLKVGGLCAFWKSSKVADELASTAYAQKVLFAPFVRTFEYDLGEAFGKRTIVFFRKAKETPSLYPRKVGEPKMKPLMKL